MKASLINNAELVIECNLDKAGDHARMVATANLIQEQGTLVIAAEGLDYIHLCTNWSHFQAGEIRAIYNDARKATLADKTGIIAYHRNIESIDLSQR